MAPRSLSEKWGGVAPLLEEAPCPDNSVLRPSLQRVSGLLTSFFFCSLLVQDAVAFQPSPIFREVAESVGVSFSHQNGMNGSLWLPEITGSGAAVFDFDRDGDLDIYLLQGGALESEQAIGESSDPSRIDQLFENLLIPTGQFRFQNVTERSGLKSGGYGMGVATGDFDNDGWTDLYVTSLRSNRLYRNQGDGTFADVTENAGIEDTRWSTSASFLDFDRDGQLDLFLTNYVKFDFNRGRKCYSQASSRDYCGPGAFEPEPDRLWRNQGDGTFEDVTDRAGVGRPGAGLGVSVSDYNRDGWLDIYVANDGMANRLWINQRGKFLDEALLAGVALNEMGRAEAGMGVDNGDFDRDGDDDLLLAHLRGETNTVYVNDGKGFFEDRTSSSGIGIPSLPMTGFGAGWIDFDNDGWLDALVVNGEVRIVPEQKAAGSEHPLNQRNQLFRNLGGGTFAEVSSQAGPAFAALLVSRGAAFGDLDNDGDVDVLVTNNRGPAQLFLNQIGQSRNWLGVEALEASGRPALGAQVEIIATGQTVDWKVVGSDGSYCSANDPRIVMGLDQVDQPVDLRITWVDGVQEAWNSVTVNRHVKLARGEGTRVSNPK